MPETAKVRRQAKRGAPLTADNPRQIEQKLLTNLVEEAIGIGFALGAGHHSAQPSTERAADRQQVPGKQHAHCGV